MELPMLDADGTAYDRFRENLLDIAAALFQGQGVGLGLLGDLLQTKEWNEIEENKLPLEQIEAIDGIAAIPAVQVYKVFEVPQKPEMFAGNATNATVNLFNHNQKIYENYIKDSASLKISIYKALPEPLQSLMLKGGSGIRNTSPKEMLKILDEKFKTLKPAQIQETSKAVTEWQFDVLWLEAPPSTPGISPRARLDHRLARYPITTITSALDSDLVTVLILDVFHY